MILDQTLTLLLDSRRQQAPRFRIGLIGLGSIVGLLAFLNFAASLA